jgi:hypothetical protein
MKNPQYLWYVIDTTKSTEKRYKDNIHIARRNNYGIVLAGPFQYREEARNYKKALCQKEKLPVKNPWYTSSDYDY